MNCKVFSPKLNLTISMLNLNGASLCFPNCSQEYRPKGRVFFFKNCPLLPLSRNDPISLYLATFSQNLKELSTIISSYLCGKAGRIRNGRLFSLSHSSNFNKSYNFRTLFSHLFPDFYLPVREGNGGAECKKGGKSIYVTGLCKKKLENEGISFSRKKRKRKKRWCEHVANGLFCV